MADRNTIATTLSAEDLQEFVARCAATPKLTLARIQEMAAERGIEISLMSARSFRDSTYERHLARIRRSQELARQISEIGSQSADPGRTIADAAAAELSAKVFDILVDMDEVDISDASKLAGAISALRHGDVEVAKLRQVIRKYEDEREAARRVIEGAKTGKGGITRETLETIEQALGLP